MAYFVVYGFIMLVISHTSLRAYKNKICILLIFIFVCDLRNLWFAMSLGLFHLFDSEIWFEYGVKNSERKCSTKDKQNT